MEYRAKFEALTDHIRALGYHVNVVPPDYDKLPAEEREAYAAITVCHPQSKRILCCLELQRDNVVMAVEMESSGVFVQQIIAMLMKNFQGIGFTQPIYHDKDGKVYIGQEAMVQFTTAQLSKTMVHSKSSKMYH